LTVPQYRFGMDPTKYGGIPLRTGASYPIFQSAANPTDPQDESTNPDLTGADAVITDVVSFAVRVRTSPTGNFVDLTASNANTGNPLFDNATGPFVFDTWTDVKDDQVDYSLWNNTTATATVPLAIKQVRPPHKGTVINAIQIQIRVWDIRTQQSRQMTIVVDM
jgi:hypothetical protein